MPKFVNTNAYAVRYGSDLNEHGVPQSRKRLAPGAVVDASAADADELKAVDGIEPAKKEDEERYAEHLARLSGAAGGLSADAERERFVGDLRTAARTASVAVPLNRVIGDDAAPAGPPTGTITTAQAVRRAEPGPAELSRFGHLAADPDKADSDDRVSEIERRQRQAQRDVEELTEETTLQPSQSSSSSDENEKEL